MGRYKPFKPMMSMGIIFFVVFCLSIIVYITIYNNETVFKKNAVVTYGSITKVVKCKDTYRVSVKYLVNERACNSTFVSNRRYYAGRNVRLYYDKQNPTVVKLTLKRNSYVLLIVAIGFCVLSILFLYRDIYMMFLVRKLALNNQYIYCTDRTEEPANIKVNNVRYVKSVFAYEDETGKSHYFSSHPYKPGKCPYSEGEAVKIYVDMAKPTKYYVSTEMKAVESIAETEVSEEVSEEVIDIDDMPTSE